MPRFSLTFLLVTVLSLLILGGCADDLRRGKLFDGGAGEVELVFNVEKVSLTRASVEDEPESRIDHAYLLFYPADASIRNSVPVAVARAEVSAGAPSTLKFKMPLSLEPSTDYRLIAVANADGYVPVGFSDYADYLQSWSDEVLGERGELCLYHSERIHSGEDACLPMIGETAGGNSFRFSIEGGKYAVSVSLSFRRMVARIDVANVISDGFNLESVALCNWRDAVTVASSVDYIGNRSGNVCGILSDVGGSDNIDFVDMPVKDESGIQNLQGALYSFPSVCYDSSVSDKESTALILKAKYGDDAESSYYRVNVGVSGNMSEVKPNTKYLVTINSVNGRGASTAEEAYVSEESLVSLSVVEDWDLDGNFAIDDNGNFIVLSAGSLEFEGDAADNREVRILTSKGLAWSVRYTADDDASEGTFRATKLTDMALVVGTVGQNTGDSALSGKFTVSALTSEGTTLGVDIRVVQNPGEGGFNDPVIPEDMPFALVPLSYDRVKVDHVEKTIEIDGFDPECFNSFIDVPFKVYVNDAISSASSVDISTSLAWPLEGRVSDENSSGYVYCKESFNMRGPVLDKNGNTITYESLYKEESSIDEGKMVNISVGAMGPDDPAIKREITISANNDKVTYALTVKPRPCIIDDVILSDNEGNLWLIQDRNIQDLSNTNIIGYIGLNGNGTKYQAYNYSCINQYSFKGCIPFKYENEASNPFTEMMHVLYRGLVKLNNVGNHEELPSLKNDWLKKYICNSPEKMTSPFYSVDNIELWNFPTDEVIGIMCKNLRISKMRTYFISEQDARDGLLRFPVCCYLPYHLFNLSPNDSLSYGYFIMTADDKLDKLAMIYFDHTGVYKLWNTSTKFSGMSRLVRPLTNDELDQYKLNYLGYGSQSHRLTICHPDTYESTSLGWIPN